jgi:F0F1-type ATP synthase membrane subunit b/b'
MDVSDWICTVLVGALVVVPLAGLAVTMWEAYRENRKSRIERELDDAQASLRATIVDLAAELGADAHETRKALIRESFLASWDETPPPR